MAVHNRCTSASHFSCRYVASSEYGRGICCRSRSAAQCTGGVRPHTQLNHIVSYQPLFKCRTANFNLLTCEDDVRSGCSSGFIYLPVRRVRPGLGWGSNGCDLPRKRAWYCELATHVSTVVIIGCCCGSWWISVSAVSLFAVRDTIHPR